MEILNKKRKNDVLWKVEYLQGRCYKCKFLYAKDNFEAIKRSKIKRVVDLNIVSEPKEATHGMD